MEKVMVENEEGETLVGDLIRNNDSDFIIVLSHGFLRNKDKGFIPILFESLADEGYNVFRFDFSGNGESGGKIGESAYLKESGDLRHILDFLEERDYNEFCLIGHSMGAGVSILTASEDPRVKLLIDIASPAHPTDIKKHRFSSEQVREVYEKGSIEYELSDGRKIIFNKSFFEQVDNTDILGAASNITIPTLIIHGSEDKAVEVGDSMEILKKLKGEKTLQMIKGTGHDFRGKDSELIFSVKNWLEKWKKD